MSIEKPEDIIYKFMLNNQRPFSLNELIEKIGSQFNLTKSIVQKSLDNLVKLKKLNEKLYGKQKIYNLIYKKYTDNEALQNELRNINRENFQLNDEYKLKENQIKALENRLKILSSTMTVDEAKLKKENLQNFRDKQIEELKKIKEKFDGGQAGTSSKSEAGTSLDDTKKIEDKYNKYVVAYRKRKRICVEMIDGILESYPKTKKHLVGELGIETDEDVGFNFNEIK